MGSVKIKTKREENRLYTKHDSKQKDRKTGSEWMPMKLESIDEMEENKRFFCWSCGKQLQTVDEISQRICFQCKQTIKDLKEDEAFFCWACGKQLLHMSEIAQGVCHPCKASIIRKIHSPAKNTAP
jgi:predicted RNA-binding Zn-ribbon protein involved in translation (DUF1610 family)